MPSEFGHTVTLRPVEKTILIGSGGAGGKELLTVDEAREVLWLLLQAIEAADRWISLETEQARRNKRRAKRLTPA